MRVLFLSHILPQGCDNTTLLPKVLIEEQNYDYLLNYDVIMLICVQFVIFLKWRRHTRSDEKIKLSHSIVNTCLIIPVFTTNASQFAQISYIL